MFATLCWTNFNFSDAFILLSANVLNFDKSKILSFGKDLECPNCQGQIPIISIKFKLSSANSGTFTIDQSKILSNSMGKQKAQDGPGWPTWIFERTNANLSFFFFIGSFRKGEFWRISSSPYSTRSPHSPQQCFLTLDRSKFCNNFWKGPPKEHPFKIITSGFRKEDSLKIHSCPYSSSGPHSPEPCFLMHQNFADNF